MIYPLEVVEKAAHPVYGIPGVVDRYDLTLARVRKHMDAWAAERGHRLMIEQRRAAQLLPEPQRDSERDKRICDGFAKLSDYLSRSMTHDTL
jgi:hypothetical protein